MKFNRKDRLKIKATADLTPMIDVVFQLILFFLLSSTFVVQASINIETPEAEGTTTLETKNVAVTLQANEADPASDGDIYWDNDVIDIDELRTRATEFSEQWELENAEAAGDTGPFVLIRADARIPVRRLVEVFGILKDAGITNLGVGAEPAGEDAAAP